MTTIKYTIEVPADRVGDLNRFMQECHIPFDPRGNVTATNDAFLSETTLMGREVREILPAINEYLEQSGMADRVRTDHEGWTPTQMQSFLEFAIQDLTWEDQKIERAWWDGSPRGWEEAKEGCPWLFGSGEDPQAQREEAAA